MSEVILERDESKRVPARQHSKWVRVLVPLAGAVLCSILIFEAAYTAWNARAIGDVMLIAPPLLGAMFFTIPAMQAWWACIRILRGD